MFDVLFGEDGSGNSPFFIIYFARIPVFIRQ